MEKPFKTIDEQIEILRKRGLLVEDDEKARDFLMRNNYYRISGYSLTLRKDDVFYPMATFQNIIDIYSFDHEMRHIILKYIETIEVQIKSMYVYEFTKVYGPTGYLDVELFVDKKEYNNIKEKVEQQQRNRVKHEAYLKHYVKDLKQDLPLWACIDLFTISDISKLYAITEEGIKRAVANDFGLNMKIGPQLLGSYLHSMTIIRNLCAHGGRIYNRLFEQRPCLNKAEKSLLLSKDDQPDNSHFYGFLIVMRRILPAEKFVEMKEEIHGLNEKYPFVSMKYYGFRDDWYTSL